MLPTEVVPTHYDLYLKPDLESFRFEGRVAIKVNVVSDTKTIVLNAKDLNVSEASVSSADSAQKWPSKSVVMDAKLERVSVHFETDLPKGPAVLSLSFAGSINSGLAGFYQSSYTHPDGSKRYLFLFFVAMRSF